MREEGSGLTPGEIVLTLERHFLELLRWPVRIAPFVVAAFIALAWRRDELSPWAIALAGGWTVICAAVLLPQLAHAHRKRLIIAGISMAAFAGLFWYGPFVGVAVMFISAVSLAAWLDTRAGVLATYAVLVAAFPLAALGVEAGWIDRQLGLAPAAYLRAGLVVSMQMGAFAYVMRRLRARQFELLSKSWATTCALRASEARFGGVFEHAPDALLIVDGDGRIAQANQRAEEMLGYTRDELAGMTFESIVTGATATKKDGGTVPVEVNRSPFEGGVLAAVRDTTERTRMEEERTRLAARLGQSQKMESLGTLAGGIAHDFNNLLAVILTNVELARHERDEATRTTQLADIETASARAAELVKQILSFSRKGSTIRVVTSLGRVVEEASRLLRASIPAGIEIASSVPPDLPAVLVDANQIHQVLMNLGTNAWHAIERPTGRIAIEVAAVELADVSGSPSARTFSGVDLPPGRYVRIRVADDGAGMDAATIARVFEPFFTTKPVGKGTGLGLSVAHGIVSNHGGAISIDSARGRGTSVDVYLPDSGVQREVAPLPPAPVPTGVGRVLVVDDEPLVATAAARLIKRLGYQVSTINDAADAIAAVVADPGRFDLVLTDENMPGIGGLEVARRMMLVRPDLPVVLASGNSQHSEATLAEARVRYRLEKPFDPAALAQTISAALGDTRVDEPVTSRPSPRPG